MSEQDLITRARRGESQAWAEIYEEFFNKIYRFIFFKIGSQEEAEDLSSRVFLKAIESLGSFRWRGVPFSAWLFRIARNLVIDHHRRAASQRRYLEQASDPDPLPSAEEEAIKAVQHEEVRRAVAQLTPAQQEVINLRFGAELSTAETAQAMKKSLVAVKALQHSALVNLRKIMSTES
ncbi:MAG: sigma-70 family RNA polymerase sigma factor [Dehalococcoidia bacterium]